MWLAGVKYLLRLRTHLLLNVNKYDNRGFGCWEIVGFMSENDILWLKVSNS